VDLHCSCGFIDKMTKE